MPTSFAAALARPLSTVIQGVWWIQTAYIMYRGAARGAHAGLGDWTTHTFCATAPAFLQATSRLEMLHSPDTCLQQSRSGIRRT